MFQCENPSCGNPGDDARFATLVPVTAEDKLDRSDQGITYWRKKATGLWCDKWKSTAATSSMLEEVKQLRQLEKGSFSITTERSVNWCAGETVLLQQ